MYGTGWMGRPGYGPNQPYYNPNAPPYQAPVEYSRPATAIRGITPRTVARRLASSCSNPRNVYARGGDAVYDAPGERRQERQTA